MEEVHRWYNRLVISECALLAKTATKIIQAILHTLQPTVPRTLQPVLSLQLLPDLHNLKINFCHFNTFSAIPKCIWNSCNLLAFFLNHRKARVYYSSTNLTTITQMWQAYTSDFHFYQTPSMYDQIGETFDLLSAFEEAFMSHLWPSPHIFSPVTFHPRQTS